MTVTNKKTVAEKLLQVEAVKFNADNPYTWTSGWKSPIYCDNRKMLSYPFVRDFIKSELCSVVFEDFPDADALAAVATAGIPWGAMVADQLKLPFAYVRPEPKGHGLLNQVEGKLDAGQKVIVLEDLISTGKSSVAACRVLQEMGIEVVGVVSLFTYGFSEAAKAFAQVNVRWQSLTTYADLLEQAIAKGIIQSHQLNSLLNWQSDPANWKG